MKYRGFTLIELLVVIAIIAILAAILFPVFAQAKLAAKKVVSLSNLRQTSIAIAMYTNDYDDLNPLQSGTLPNIGWDYGDEFDTPATWQPGYSAQYYEDQADSWGNSIQPYLKSYDVLNDPMQQLYYATWGAYSNATTKYYQANYTYNGLLTSYAASAVASPSNLTSVWQGLGNFTIAGEHSSDPWLVCNNANAPCVYVPTAITDTTCGNGINGGSSSFTDVTYWGGSPSNVTVWLYGQGLNYAMADTHAKWRPMGNPHNSSTVANQTAPPTDRRIDPFTDYDAQGYPWLPWMAGCQAGLFRPDFDFTDFSGWIQ